MIRTLDSSNKAAVQRACLPQLTTHYYYGVLVQLDLQSVEKSTFEYVRMSSRPENVGNWSSSLQNEAEFPPASIYVAELFPAAPAAQLQHITVSTFSVQLGQIR